MYRVIQRREWQRVTSRRVFVFQSALATSPIERVAAKATYRLVKLAAAGAGDLEEDAVLEEAAVDLEARGAVVRMELRGRLRGAMA
jgi:hypothetical protein